jgi:starvation-inducible DNA-binding protein
MTQILDHPITDHSTEQAPLLQQTLLELIELSLQAKQAHWNVVGPTFKPIHEFLDEMTDQYRGWYDDVAERLTAIGVAPDGRSQTVVAGRPFETLPAGSLPTADIGPLFDTRVSALADRIRQRAGDIGETDMATQDLLIEILRGVEKQRWMLRAHSGI